MKIFNCRHVNCLMTLCVSLLLANCGSDTPKSGFSISGTITAAPGTNIDSDVNDPNQLLISNNSTAEIQFITAPVTLAGFLTQHPLLYSTFGGNFDAEPDPEDHFQVVLNKNDLVTLEISDWPQNNNIDFDLSVQSITNTSIPIQRSTDTGQFKQLLIPEDGTYQVVISALQGSSNYTLAVGTNNRTLTYSKNTAQFVPNQFIFRSNTQSKAYIRSSSGIQKTDEAQLNQLGMMTLKGNTPSMRLIAAHPLLKPLSAPQQRGTTKASQAENQHYETLVRLAELRNTFGADAVSLNYIYHPLQIPDDPLYQSQWHYPHIDLPQAWNITDGSAQYGDDDDIVVAVIDTGIYLQHQDLTNKLIKGYDFVSDLSSANDGSGIDNNPDDPGDGQRLISSSWHGTHVAGIIGAESNNSIGIAGIAWGAKIMPIRVLGVGGGTSYDILQGLKYAAGLANDSGLLPDKPADIINMSLGGENYDPAMQDVVSHIANNGSGTTLMVAAAGNSSSASPFYPAAFADVISVSAVGANNLLSPYSNYGSTIDITAPGGDMGNDLNGDGQADGILSSLVEVSASTRISDYGYYQGTSMAAPHISGVLALMKSVHPEMTHTEFQQLLQSGKITQDLGLQGRDNSYGYGIINAFKAVYEARALAQGTEIEAMLISTPSQVDFGLEQTLQLIELAQLSAPTDTTSLNISSIDLSAPWLSISPYGTTAEGELGLYQIVVDRTILLDGNYNTHIVITADNGSTTTITITLQVNSNPTYQSNANTGTLYLLLVDEYDNTVTTSQPLIPINGEYQFDFSAIAAGNYYLVAGSDLDNDGLVCDEGESCGAWPILASPQLISVESNLSNVDFVVNIDSMLFESASMVNNSFLSQGYRRTIITNPSQKRQQKQLGQQGEDFAP